MFYSYIVVLTIHVNTLPKLVFVTNPFPLPPIGKYLAFLSFRTAIQRRELVLKCIYVERKVNKFLRKLNKNTLYALSKRLKRGNCTMACGMRRRLKSKEVLNILSHELIS